MKKQSANQPPNISARLVLRSRMPHVVSLTQSSTVTSFLAEARLINPNANLARTLQSLIDLGAFMAITFPALVSENFRSLDRSQALQYFEDAMPRIDNWTLKIIISRASKNGDRVIYTCDANHRDFTTETNLLIAFADTHHLSLSEVLYDAAHLGVLRVKAGDCRILYGALLRRIEELKLNDLFF